ncbi:hypothetical protein [Spirosoma luteolum]
MQPSLNQEQQICLHCGFCCDGTLFEQAMLEPGEQLPPRLKDAYVVDGNQAFFRQPCTYFAGCCTIYDQPRLAICSSYRCQLLRKVAAGAVPADKALQTVHDMVRIRADIYVLYRQLISPDAPADFISLKAKVLQAAEAMPADEPTRDDMTRLAIKCIMLNHWMMKTFRASSDGPANTTPVEQGVAGLADN